MQPPWLTPSKHFKIDRLLRLNEADMARAISEWLEGLGLGEYAEAFAENKIDFRVLPELDSEDLREMDIPLGPRKLLLKALAELHADGDATIGTAKTAAKEAASIGQPAFEAERRQLTVMFVDLVGSTALSGQLDPEEMREAITTYQNTVAGVVTQFDGHVAKYMGDGVLCYFGWPRAHEDDAERAVRAGLAIVQALHGLKASNGEALIARTGIATGLVVVGDLIGEGAAQEEAVVGETPNLAARLQGLAEPGQVVLADSTRRLLGNAFDFSDLGQQELKGITELTNVFAVSGERIAETRFAARQTQHLSSLVGRDQELALLKERWRQAKGGEGQMVLLTGEAGIGKSRITRALIDSLSGEDYVRISYQCSPYHSDSALYPAIQQLSLAADFDTDDTPEVKLDRLEELLRRGSNDISIATPLLAGLLGLGEVADARFGTLEYSPQQRRMRTLDALLDQLVGLAGKTPVLFVFEDAHWIDPTTLELVELCLDRIDAERVMLLVTARPTFEYGFGGHPIVTRLALNRLGREQVSGIVKYITKGKTLPDELLELIATKTDGVPLFVEEFTKTLLESEFLREDEDAYVLIGPLQSLNVPTSLHDSLMARLDRLHSIKEVAQTAACIGREFDYPTLHAILPLEDDALSDALEQLREAELLFRRGAPPEATYIFKHALIRDAAYESLLRANRQKIHALLVEALEQSGEASAEILAHHATEAGFTEKAIDYWLMAGEQALRRSANVEAINHIGRGLALLDASPQTNARDRRELSLQLALGPALMAARGQGTSEMRQAYARARVLGQQLGDTPAHFRALWGLWRSHHVLSEHDTAQGFAEQCLSVANTSEDVAFGVVARFALGGTLIFKGDFAGARPNFERAISLYDIEKHRSLGFVYGQDPGPSSISYMSFLQWYSGFPEQSVKTGKAALDLAKASNHPFTVAMVHMYLAMTYLYCRDWPSVLSVTTAAIGLAAEQGLPQVQKLASTMHGRALVEAGDFEHGIPQMEQSIAQRKAIDVRVVKLFEIALLAEAYGKEGRIDDGLHVVTEALDYANQTGEGFHLPELHRLKGELLLRQDAAATERCFHDAIEISRRQGVLALVLRAATSLANLWWEQGKTTKARDLLVPVYSEFTEGFDTPDLKDAKALLEELS